MVVPRVRAIPVGGLDDDAADIARRIRGLHDEIRGATHVAAKEDRPSTGIQLHLGSAQDVARPAEAKLQAVRQRSR